MSVRFDKTKAQFLEVENPSSFDWERDVSRTVAAWVYVFTSDATGPVVSKAHRSPSALGWAFNTVGFAGPTFSFHLANQDAGQSLVAYGPNLAYPWNAWAHLAATYDGSVSLAGVKLYVNGAQVPHGKGLNKDADTFTAATIRNGDPVRIAATTSPEFWTGAVSHVCLDDRVLAASEIAALADPANLGRAPSSFLERAPMLFLPLTTVDDLADTSGWGNDAKVVGPVSFGEPS